MFVAMTKKERTAQMAKIEKVWFDHDISGGTDDLKLL
jgi:hypothetical protein